MIDCLEIPGHKFGVSRLERLRATTFEHDVRRGVFSHSLPTPRKHGKADRGRGFGGEKGDQLQLCFLFQSTSIRASDFFFWLSFQCRQF